MPDSLKKKEHTELPDQYDAEAAINGQAKDITVTSSNEANKKKNKDLGDVDTKRLEDRIDEMHKAKDSSRQK